MNLLQRLNPLNNLFTRLFLWFWLVTVVMILLALFVARQLTANLRVGTHQTDAPPVCWRI